MAMLVLDGKIGLTTSPNSVSQAGSHSLIWFALMLAFVALVSIHDAALLVVTQDLIVEFEQNPLGCWLLELGAGSVWPFIIVKMIGTSLVCAVVVSIFEYSKRWGLLLVAPLAGFQAILLSYLYYS
jgi:hypothetical protein